MSESAPEPARFVVQRHESRTPHFDLRLERDGVFKSWAVPNGIPEEPGIQRLAIQVEDHPLAFGEFEGTIAVGEYGAGEIPIWDRGTCTIDAWTARCGRNTVQWNSIMEWRDWRQFGQLMQPEGANAP